MASKSKLTLEFTMHPGGWGRTVDGKALSYRVKSITNSIQYTPGQGMTSNEVQSVIDCGTYDVTVVGEKF